MKDTITRIGVIITIIVSITSLVFAAGIFYNESSKNSKDVVEIQDNIVKIDGKLIKNSERISVLERTTEIELESIKEQLRSQNDLLNKIFDKLD